MKVLTANQAKRNAPWNQPDFDRGYFKKIMLYTFTLIDQRSKVGYGYVELSLTQFPKLEKRRLAVLNRLGYKTRQHEMALIVEWNTEQ